MRRQRRHFSAIIPTAALLLIAVVVTPNRAALAASVPDTSACATYEAQAHPVQYAYVAVTPVTGHPDMADAVLCLRGVSFDPGQGPGLYVSSPMSSSTTYQVLASSPAGSTSSGGANQVLISWPPGGAAGGTWRGAVRFKIFDTAGKSVNVAVTEYGGFTFTGQDTGNNYLVTTNLTAHGKASPAHIVVKVKFSAKKVLSNGLVHVSGIVRNIGDEPSGPFKVTANESKLLTIADLPHIGSSKCSRERNFTCSFQSFQPGVTKSISWWVNTTAVKKTTKAPVALTARQGGKVLSTHSAAVSILTKQAKVPKAKPKKRTLTNDHTVVAMSGAFVEKYSGGSIDGESGFVLIGGNVGHLLSNKNGLRLKEIDVGEQWVFDVVRSPSAGGPPIEFDGEYQPPGAWSLTNKKVTKTDTIYTYERGGSCNNTSTCRLATFNSSDYVVMQGTVKKITHEVDVQGNINGHLVKVSAKDSGNPIKSRFKVLKAAKVSKPIVL